MEVKDYNDTVGCWFVYTSEEALPLLRTSFEVSLTTIIIPIVTLWGSFFNFAFLYVLYRVEKMQTITNCYLGNLAVADLGTLLTGLVVFAFDYTNSPEYSLGISFQENWSCIAAALVGYGFYFASVAFVYIVIFDRYRAICFPLKYRAMRTKTYVICVTCVLWIISVGLATLRLSETKSGIGCIQDDSSMFKIGVCLQNKFSLYLIKAFILVDIFQFLLSVSAIAYMTTRIIHGLSSRAVSSYSIGIMKSRNRISRMLIINAFIYFLCQTPYQVYNFYLMLSIISDNIEVALSSDFMTYVMWIGRVAAFLNSSINPVIYNMTNKNYRIAFQVAFKCRKAETKERIKTANVLNHLTDARTSRL